MLPVFSFEVIKTTTCTNICHTKIRDLLFTISCSCEIKAEKNNHITTCSELQLLLSIEGASIPIFSKRVLSSLKLLKNLTNYA